MGIDLRPARVNAEALQLDTIEVTRDPKGKQDTELDPVTLKLVSPAGQPVVVYDASSLGTGNRVLGGKARIRPLTAARPGAVASEGGGQYSERDYVVSTPWDAPVFAKGDLIRCVTSSWDPELVNKVFIVRDVQVHTFLVIRQMLVELRA